jgi:hypothetical protein
MVNTPFPELSTFCLFFIRFVLVLIIEFLLSFWWHQASLISQLESVHEGDGFFSVSSSFLISRELIFVIYFIYLLRKMGQENMKTRKQFSKNSHLQNEKKTSGNSNKSD